MGSRWDTGRIEAFSDGVFAFAITLLVLDIRVPESQFSHLWHGIGDQWPSYLGFVTSFLTVGGIWMVHHGMFLRVKYANRQVTTVNLLLLMAIAFLPFPTRLMAEAIHDLQAERAAVTFYGAWLLVIALTLKTLWASVTSERSLLKPEVSDEEVDAITRATTPNLAFYAGAIVLALLAPYAAAFGYLAIAIIAILRARGDSTSTHPAPKSA